MKSRRKPSEILREAPRKISRALRARIRRAFRLTRFTRRCPALLKQTARLARRRGWRVAMHVAESMAE